MQLDESSLNQCLFFTSNRLSNILRRLANEVYKKTGIATPYIYLFIVVNQYPGISMTELSEKLDIAPSTCTRFVNALEQQAVIRKENEWKSVHIYLTEEGKKKGDIIDSAGIGFAQKCISVLGAETCANLAADMMEAADQFEQSL